MSLAGTPFIDLEGPESLFEHSKTGVLFANFDGDIIGTNRAIEKMLGYSSVELLNHNISNFEDATNKNTFIKIIGQFKNSSAKNAEHQKIYIHKNGDFVFIDESMSVVDKSESHDHYIMLLCTRRTSACQTEQLDVGINKYLHKAIESTSAYITVLDLNGKIEYVNKVLNGIPKEEFIGSSLYNWVPEDEVKVLKENIKKIFLDRNDIFYETEFVDPSGHMHYFYHDMSPIIIDDDIVAISFVTNDITELKLLEQKLSRNLDLVKLSLQAAEVGVWDWDSESEDLIWDDNLYKILGSDISEVHASFDTLLKIMHDEDKDRISIETMLAIENRSKFEGEFRIHRVNDNEIRWISFKSKFTVDKENNITRLIGIAWDNTSTKEIEIERQRTIELERQNIELQQFAYLASHDLKSPLRTINNFSGLLTKRYSKDLDETALTYLGHIQSSVDRMNTQIRDLLQYAMLGYNGKQVEIDCNKLIQGVIEDLDFTIRNSNCAIHIEELPILNGYRTEIALLFENLITNAIKFRKENIDPVINISYKENENFFEFAVVDNGIGIDEKYKEKIFVLFQRLHFPEDYEGTGIGLAHCKKTVELHGGKIWIESTEGEGSTFHFTIQK